MEKLTVLGTGYAMALRCYNTCFALHQGEEVLLVDAGGGNGILVQLQKAGIDPADIHHLIVTHAHTDHILGVVWVIRKIATLMLDGKYEGEFHIWCHKGLPETIETLVRLTVQGKFAKLIGDRILLHGVTDGEQAQILGHTVTDGEQAQILGHTVTFFDIHSTKMEQYGFTAEKDGKKLTCLGDEPYNPLCEGYVKGSDWLLCEAFCLYGDREKFKPYEKHHSTVKEACELAAQLEVPHLVLWHTEDKTYEDRQRLYTAEGKEYYQGDLHVPYDLDVIAL